VRRFEDGSVGQEFDNHFAASNVRMEMRNACSPIIAGDCTKSNLPDAFTAHPRARINPGLGFSMAWQKHLPLAKTASETWSRDRGYRYLSLNVNDANPQCHPELVEG
jgi:hypothetical protein